MPPIETIREYLVSIGYHVDDATERKYNDALKRSGEIVKKFSYGTAETAEAAVSAGVGAVGMFAAVGGAFVAAVAAVAGATVGLGASVAKQDLVYQMMARRMFMTTDAVRKMDMATKALGMTLPEIIFGPPEVQERYHQLMLDENRMLMALGGDQGEAAFRRIREIQFQFTRLEPAIKIFGMALTQDVINKLFGGTEALETRLKHFVDWFEKAIPDIADKWSNVLAPAIMTVAKALGWAWDKLAGIAGFVNQWAGNTGDTRTRQWFNQHPGGFTMEQLAPGASEGGGMGAIDARIAASPGASRFARFLGVDSLTQHNRETAERIANKYGLDENFFAALIQAESGWNPKARNPESGAYGFGQFMPQNMHMYGMDASDPEQNIDMAGHYIRDLLKKYKGDKNKALREYGGFIAKDPSDYINSIIGQGVTFQPQAYHPGGSTIGPVTITIMQPNATPAQITRAVKEGFDEHSRNAARQMFAQGMGAYG